MSTRLKLLNVLQIVFLFLALSSLCLFQWMFLGIFAALFFIVTAVKDIVAKKQDEIKSDSTK